MRVSLVVPVCVLCWVSMLRLRTLVMQPELSLVLIPLSAIPTELMQVALSEVCRWQASKEEPLRPCGAAAAAMAQVRTSLKWAEGIVSDAGASAECQLEVLAQKRRRTTSPAQQKRPRPPQPCRTWLPLGRDLVLRQQGPRKHAVQEVGQLPGIEGALDFLCDAGVDEPRVLVEFRELHDCDPLAALAVLAQFRRQVEAGKLQKPNNYARSLTSEKRKEAGLWTYR